MSKPTFIEDLLSEAANQIANDEARLCALALLLTRQVNYAFTLKESEYLRLFGPGGSFEGYVLHGHWNEDRTELDLHLDPTEHNERGARLN